MEAINAISPYTNPTAPSGWDVSRGYAYVAIADSGIDPIHADLAENFRPHFSQAFYQPPCIPSNLTDVDEQGLLSPCPASIFVGHGTHVAGIIGATQDNSLGVAGICKHCSLIIGRRGQNQQGATGATDSHINALFHSILRGAQLINNSSGLRHYLRLPHNVVYCHQIPPGSNGYCDVLALINRREGILVAASGNNNGVPLNTWSPATHFPASEPQTYIAGGVAVTNPYRTISVGGITHQFNFWLNDGVFCPTSTPLCGSNLDKVEFVAPAQRIVSTFYRYGTWNATAKCDDHLNGAFSPYLGFDECTGTSMAAPHITGGLAIVRSAAPLLSRDSILAAATATGPVLGGWAKMLDVRAATLLAASTSSSLTPLFAMTLLGSNPAGAHDNLYTVAPQMAVASEWGTVLPQPVVGSAQYVPDAGANAIAWYSAFPDSLGGVTPRTYMFVFTTPLVSGVSNTPLYRLSKLQNTGSGFDRCGNPMPVPTKKPVIHIYTTNIAERHSLTTGTHCYNYDGVEGYLATQQIAGYQAVYRLYNPSLDSFRLATASQLAAANAAGYTASQTFLGYAVAN